MMMEPPPRATKRPVASLVVVFMLGFVAALAMTKLPFSSAKNMPSALQVEVPSLSGLLFLGGATEMPRHWILDDLSAEEVKAVAKWVIAMRPGTKPTMKNGYLSLSNLSNQTKASISSTLSRGQKTSDTLYSIPTSP